MNSRTKLCIGFLAFTVLGESPALASEVSFSFSNDSMNGLRLSDAYETHDMGIRYSTFKNWYDLNFAIVSPDMYVYRNQYREANRSYGEIIQFTYGSNTSQHYCKFTAVGKFGLDTAQDFAHELFGLQTVADINELVRMPNRLHAGCGTTITKNDWDVTIQPYVGTDRASFTVDKRFQIFENTHSSLSSKFGVSFIGYDNIVSAKPIAATHRSIVPDVSLNYSYALNDGINLVFSERASLPTIANDSSVFLQFSAKLSFILD